MDERQPLPARTRQWWRVVLGSVLVLVGLIALLTPLTPGSWLLIVGAELLGLRFLFRDQARKWFSSRPR